MRFLCRVAARSVLMLHLMFSLAAMFGGLAMLILFSAFWIHIPLLLWAAAVNLFGWTCPLTPLEKRLWRCGGRDAYEGGFLVHYFGPLLNLERADRRVEIRTGGVILAWNAMVYSGVLLYVWMP